MEIIQTCMQACEHVDIKGLLYPYTCAYKAVLLVQLRNHN